ncbi:MAG: ABC transporter permease [Nocardiopsaceae bacterium]|nr:ABC transporter permease [Nocardiopsaceae bacterium]
MQTLASKKGLEPEAPAGDKPPLLARARVYKVGVQVTAPIAAMIILLVLWQIVVVGGRIPDYILPAPSSFLPMIGKSWPQLWSATVTTGEESIIGFLIAIVFSIPLALLLASIRVIRDMVYPLVVFFQLVPKIAIAPLLIVWFGANQTSVIVLTWALCFFPILVNAMAGFMALDEQQLYITKSMGASRWQTFRYLRLQSALPFIFAGLRVAVVLAVVGVIVGEFVGSNSGLGYIIEASSGVLNTPLIFADLVVLTVLGLVLNYIVVGAEWLLMPWKRKVRRSLWLWTGIS